MTKSEYLYIDKRHIETALTEVEGRRSPSAAHAMEHKAGMWEEMIKRWQSLTTMRVQDGVAIIPVRGTITPDDPFAAYFGETSLSMVLENFEKALSDPKVKKIILDIFSPGGFVYGVEAAANTIFAARGKKPIIAYTGALAASAAYWLASAADEIVLASETSEVGSIGVYLAHFDYSDYLAKVGIKVTEITSGEFKGLGSPYTPLTEEDEKQLQKDVDYLMTRFVETVARNRGMKVEEVLKSANGLTFYGSDAVKRGLADSVNSIQEVIAMSTNAQSGQAADPANPATAEVAALQATVAKLTETVAALTASAKLTTEQQAEAAKIERANVCKEAVKTAFGREATAEEIALHEEMSEAGRKTWIAGLAEQAQRVAAAVKAAGLTEETATRGVEEERQGPSGLIAQAGKAIGLPFVQ